jgi:hypothetical protein
LRIQQEGGLIMAIIIKPPVSGGGGGAVDSVNGATGVVVLTTDNINAGSNADRQYFTTSIQSDIDSKADQSSLDTVQGKTLYSNSYYVNDGVNDIQTVVNAIAGGSGAYAIYISAGSYGGSTLTISDAPSGMDIIAPYHPTSGHICELVSRGLTISGATTTRVRISDLNVEGALLIDGTLGRHYFKNCIFDSTVTITNATANFVTFEQCSFAGGISIASSVTATVYFDRCAMGNQLVTSLRAGAGSPLLTVLTECSGVNALQVNLTSNVVLVGRTGFNDLSVVQYQNSDSYVYDLNNGLSTSFSGSYTELRNKPTIPSAYTDEQARDAAGTALANGTHTGISFVNNDAGDTINATVSLSSFSTDNLSQGSTNKYFSDTLARSAFTAGAGISITTGTIASTITQYTDADADARITAQKGQANGVCELDANSLVPTNHLPPLAITDVHVVADATERLALTVQEGDVAIQTDDSTSWIYSGTAWVQFSTGGAVLSVNGQTGTVSLDTDDITEGATNKYFSDTLARGAFTAGTGISITTGTIASTITQYTDTLAKTASVVDSMVGSQTDQAPSVSSVKAYYTAGTGISLTGGTIASTITQYTDELAQDASASLLTTGTHTGISYSYVDGSNKIDSTVSLAGFSIDALSDVDTSTTPPTSGQALAWDGTSKWIPASITGGSRPSYTTVASFPLTISAPASSVVKARYYLNNGASAVTVNLPAVASCDGLEIVIKLLGTGTATIDASGSETIDGALTFALTLQNSSINLVATSAGWRIE